MFNSSTPEGDWPVISPFSVITPESNLNLMTKEEMITI